MWFLQYLIDFVHPCLGDPYSYFFFSLKSCLFSSPEPQGSNPLSLRLPEETLKLCFFIEQQVLGPFVLITPL